MRVAFYTLGCKVNQYETESMAEKFILAGHSVVPFSQVADVYVINTCSVTAESDRKSRQMIRRAKAKNPDAIICAVGCYVQTAGAENAAFDGIDIVVGNTKKQDIVTLVETAPQRLSVDNRKYIPYIDDIITGTSDKTRAVLKIEDGCNNFCSYCIIPYARGRVASKPFGKALSEFKGLVDTGVKEIVVTGIEIASYGLDTGDSLAALLGEFDRYCADRPVRIRLGSLEPRLITEEFADALSKMPHICPHFHLSMQSGCDETLARMNRKYTSEQFYQAAKRLRRYMPDTQLTTDLIVGFPGETDEEFAKTLEFLKKIRFLKVHVFPYSVRQGTPAARMENQVAPAVKSERAAKAISLCDDIRAEIIASLAGEHFEVLFETRRKGVISGYTKNYIPVVTDNKNLCEHSFVKVVLRGDMQDDFALCDVL